MLDPQEKHCLIQIASQRCHGMHHLLDNISKHVPTYAQISNTSASYTPLIYPLYTMTHTLIHLNTTLLHLNTHPPTSQRTPSYISTHPFIDTHDTPSHLHL